MQIFTLAVLQEQSSQVPVLANNVTLDSGEDRSCQNGARVFPFLKEQGSQMCFIAYQHPRGTSGSSSSYASITLIHASVPSSISANAVAASVSTTSVADYTSTSTTSTVAAAAAVFCIADAAVASASTTDQLHQSSCQYRSHIPSTLHLDKDGLYIKWNCCPHVHTSSEDDAFMQRFGYRYHLLDTSTRKVVEIYGDVISTCTLV